MDRIAKTNEPIKLEMATPDGKAATRMYAYEIDYFTALGKEIKISPKANVTINKPGFKTEFYVETVNVCIGIGDNHSADLIMSKDAWEALKSGEEITVTTTEQFKNKYVYSRKKNATA